MSKKESTKAKADSGGYRETYSISTVDKEDDNLSDQHIITFIFDDEDAKDDYTSDNYDNCIEKVEAWLEKNYPEEMLDEESGDSIEPSGVKEAEGELDFRTDKAKKRKVAPAVEQPKTNKKTKGNTVLCIHLDTDDTPNKIGLPKEYFVEDSIAGVKDGLKSIKRMIDEDILKAEDYENCFIARIELGVKKAISKQPTLFTLESAIQSQGDDEDEWDKDYQFPTAESIYEGIYIQY